jgi:trimethylamine--corrinoid protein Co-methyltransferase
VPAFIKRRVRPHDLLNEDGLDLIERKADQLLAEVGIDINEAQDRELFRAAGAAIDGTRVRFEPGMVRELASTAPREFTQHARNPDKSVDDGCHP